MALHALNLPASARGEWHVPDSPQQVAAGEFRYEPPKMELHLQSSLKSPDTMMELGGSVERYPVVLGTTTSGDACTLLQAYRVSANVSIGSGGMRQSETLRCRSALIGGHFLEGTAFPAVRFRIPGLPAWLGRHAITTSIGREVTGHAPEVSIAAVPPPDECFYVPSIDASLEWSIHVECSNKTNTSVTVTESGWLTIRPTALKPIDWFVEQFSRLEIMLAFVAGAPMGTDCVITSIAKGSQDASVLSGALNGPVCSFQMPHEFLLMRDTLGVTLHELVAAWFALPAQLGPPSQLAAGVLRANGLWSHLELLSLMQALEGYHRARLGGAYMPEDDYKAVQAALSQAIPETVAADHRDALRSRIRYGNQHALRKRLAELTKVIDQPLREVVLGGKGTVPGSWIDTRNYYTHWDEELRPKSLEGLGMHQASIRMSAWLRVLYLQLMGIPQESILRAFQGMSGLSQELQEVENLELI